MPTLFKCCAATQGLWRSEEHTSELQSQSNIVCRLLLEKKKTRGNRVPATHERSAWAVQRGESSDLPRDLPTSKERCLTSAHTTTVPAGCRHSSHDSCLP